MASSKFLGFHSACGVAVLCRERDGRQETLERPPGPDAVADDWIDWRRGRPQLVRVAWAILQSERGEDFAWAYCGDMADCLAWISDADRWQIDKGTIDRYIEMIRLHRVEGAPLRENKEGGK